ncbi:MAG: TonB-dependent receptor [Muribaculaceae bacterium]|nr:TonB-dependent receptor [Muribaculaceae bacterium]
MMKRFLILGILLSIIVMAIDAQKVTIHAKERPADKVFADLMRQSGKNFIYPSGLLNSVKVTVSASDESLPRVLDRMLTGTDIAYRMRGNNVMLFRKETPKPKKATLSGFVREEGTEEALPGVTVTVLPSGLTTSTNVQGFYSLTLPAGTVSVSFSTIGYEPKDIDGLVLTASRKLDVSLSENPTELEGVVVTANPNSDRAINSAEIGSMNVSRASILATPVIFGESDVIKTLQLEPGVSSGIEGMAGMYVHGGAGDENLYMLDNIPLYQVNHFGGLFSAFNTEAMRNVDFYKSSFPAKYDGRLSSYIDVNTKDGSMESHHGGVKIGLTSAAVNVDGPIWKEHTSYSFAARRSWYDVLTIPVCAIFNSMSPDEKVNFGYAFTDINAKITHRFSDYNRIYVMFYYGEDYLNIKEKWGYNENTEYELMKANLRWGNIVASAGWQYAMSPTLFGEVTGAFTRYASHLKHSQDWGTETDGVKVSETYDETISKNYIHDWILKADFDWRPHHSHRITFGGGYTRHSFLPSRSSRTLIDDQISSIIHDRVHSYGANEFNLYAGGDWSPWSPLRFNYGLHFSLFNIDGNTLANLSPRLTFRYQPAGNWAIKGGYSRTVQYVHQLLQSSISLPTDQWVPIVGNQKPQTADKLSIGGYYTLNREFTFSLEGYYKWMRNLLEYADEYYLLPPDAEWADKLAAGRGQSKGIDFKISKDRGKLTGHIAYSLLWADRRYPDKNGGRPFPARFDNRHKINVLLNWKINQKWEISASWTGMSGNRVTLPTQMWEDPSLGPWNYDMPLATTENNFRLPFYHRMDLNFRRNTRHGYWNFSLYNAYCNLNTIAVIRDYNDGHMDTATGSWISEPVFKKLRLIPIIPSVSYTWLF